MKKDLEIQQNVTEEIKNIPSVNASEIGVSVKNGIVTLSGIVNSYPKKIALERAVLQVKDVSGIAEELQVKLNGSDKRTDPEIAQAVLYAIEWHSGIDKDKIKILVEDGVVTMTGTVLWDYQRKLALKTIVHIQGVRNVINNITITEGPLPDRIKEKIQSSFIRNASIEANNVKIEMDGNKVILKGKVNTWLEKKEAEDTVWKMAGVAEVDNQLVY